MNTRHVCFRRTPLLLVAFLAGPVACDLDMKDLGDEPGGSSDGGDDGVSPGDPCSPGDQMPAADGCNTCVCGEDGTYACTEIGCDPSAGDGSGGGGECMPGDEMPAGDGCNTCSCGDDGLWACTQIGCEPQCTPGEMMPAGDGCNTCTCGDDGMWACTALGCDPAPSTQVCDGTEPADPFTILDAAVVGESLVVTVQYGGGCAQHLFTHCWDGAFLESFPVQVQTALSHEDNDDPCDALPSEELTINLVPLRTAYEMSYGPGPASILIGLDGWVGSLEYAW